MNTDFSVITACGGDCTGCEHYINKTCEGCNRNGGQCVKMWTDGCPVSKCCKEHGALFCGLCGEFPCELLKSTMTWEKNGIERLAECAEEYRRREVDFSAELPALWKGIGTHGVMTLSTCAENRVTSRPVSTVVIDGKFYCQTDVNYLKCRQILLNRNTALCYKKYSIEGVCRIIGKPLEHDFFVRAMKKYYRPAVERYSQLPSECVLEITPTLIYSWSYALTKPYMEYWDFENMTYRKEWK